MFIVLLSYTAPLERIDAVTADHRRWLDACYERGLFLASGPQMPRTGGAILAHGLGRQALEALLAEDPFAMAGVAEYRVIEVAVRKADPRLGFLVEG